MKKQMTNEDLKDRTRKWLLDFESSDLEKEMDAGRVDYDELKHASKVLTGHELDPECGLSQDWEYLSTAAFGEVVHISTTYCHIKRRVSRPVTRMCGHSGTRIEQVGWLTVAIRELTTPSQPKLIAVGVAQCGERDSCSAKKGRLVAGQRARFIMRGFLETQRAQPMNPLGLWEHFWCLASREPNFGDRLQAGLEKLKERAGEVREDWKSGLYEFADSIGMPYRKHKQKE